MYRTTKTSQISTEHRHEYFGTYKRTTRIGPANNLEARASNVQDQLLDTECLLP